MNSVKDAPASALEEPATLVAIMLLGMAGVLSQGLVPFIVRALIQWTPLRALQAGLCVSAEMVGSAMGSVAILFPLARLNRRLLARLALLTVLAGNVACLSCTTFPHFAAARFLGGVGSGMTTAAFGMLAATRLPERSFAIFSGSTVALIAGCGAALPFIEAIWGFRSLFVLMAMPAICALGMTALLPEHIPFRTALAAHAAGRAIRTVAPALSMLVLFFVAVSAFFSYLPALGAFSGVAEISTGRIIPAFFLFGGLLGSIAATATAQRIPRLKVIVAALAIAAAAVCLSTFFPSPTHFLASAAFFLFFWFVTYPFLMGVLAKIDPSGQLTIWGILTQSFGWIIGPALGGFLVERHAYAAFGALCAACLLLAMVCAIVGEQRSNGSFPHAEKSADFAIARETFIMEPVVSEAGDLIARWFEAFQGKEPRALTTLVTLPFRFSRGGNLTVLSTENEFVDWWTNYVAAVRAGGFVAKGEILRLRVDRISASATIVTLQSARLDRHGDIITIVTTAFIVYAVAGTWKVGASIADAFMPDGRIEPMRFEALGDAVRKAPTDQREKDD